MDIRLVVFDIGGVMIRICHKWSDAVALSGVKTTNPDPGGLSQCHFLDEYQKSAISVEEYLDQLAAHLGAESREEALKVHNHILVDEYVGMLDVVNGLKAAGIKTACLSNTADLHWQEMGHSGRFPAYVALDGHFASHIEKLNKPAPEIYHRVEEVMGVKGSEVVFFDDYQRNIDGAYAVGWSGTRIDPDGSPADQVRAFLGDNGLVF